MSFEMVGACLAENLELLGPGGYVPPENRALWNLSNALLNLSMAVEGELTEIRQQSQTISQQIRNIPQQR